MSGERRRASVAGRSIAKPVFGSASFVVLVITLLAFALRLYHLDAMSFWSDEGISVIRARVEFPDVLNILPVEHTPLYFVALHQWMHAAGEGDFAVRFFSLFFSVLTVPLVYKLGEAFGRGRQTSDGGRIEHSSVNMPTPDGTPKPGSPGAALVARPLMGGRSSGRASPRTGRFMSQTPRLPSAIGIFAAVLCAVNPLQVWYAQEARMYSQVVALCAAAAWCLLKAVRISSSQQQSGSAPKAATGIWQLVNEYWLAFAFLATAALYTHYFAALIVAAFALWTGILLLRRELDWRPAALGFGLIALLFAPWLPRAVAALSFPGWQAAADPLSLPERYLVAYTLGTTIPDEWRWLALGFLLLLGLGTLALARRRSGSAWLPIVYVFVPFGLLMLLALRKPGYHERYLIVITPMLFVLLAVGLNQMRQAYSVVLQNARALRLARFAWRSTFVVALVFVLLASAFSLDNLYFDASYAKPDFRAAAQYVDALSRQGDGLIFDGPDPFKAFYRYFSRKRVSAFDDFDFDPQDGAESDAFLAHHVQEHERWWVVLYFHPAGPTEDWLAQHGYQTSSRWFNGIRVLLYATPSDAVLRMIEPESVQTDLPLRILSLRTLPEVQPGDVLPVVVQWQPTGALPADYQVSVRLLDAAGNRLKQLDRRPLDGRVPTSQWKPGDVLEDRYGLLVPDNAGTCTCQVELILYPLGSADVLHARLSNVKIVGKE